MPDREPIRTGRVAALFLCGAFLGAAPARGGEVIRLRVALHVDTSISHGRRTWSIAGVPVRRTDGDAPRTMETIARMAREQGLDAVVLADRARAEVSYGLTPFSRLFKVTAATGSVRSYGAKRWLDRIDAAEKKYGVVLVPGVECIPYYRWEGGPLGGLRLRHLYEHLVLIGLDTPEALEGLPDTAGGYGLRLSWTVGFNLVFVALIMLGWKRARRRGKWNKAAGAAVVLASALALADSAPFLPHRISAYREPAENPADVLGRYAKEHGALAAWAHPCVRPGSLPHRLKAASGIEIEVRPYPERLRETHEYDAFAMFDAGIAAGRAGGAWDAALAEYTAGRRERPVWAVAECDFDADSSPGVLAETQTVVWAAERSRRGVLDALRRGRCYATFRGTAKHLRVEAYRLADGARVAESGDTLRTASPAVSLFVRLVERHAPPPAGGTLRTRLRAEVIVDGAARPAALAATPGAPEDGRPTLTLDLRATVERPAGRDASFVRVLLCDRDQPVLALNPIFIRWQGAKPKP